MLVYEAKLKVSPNQYRIIDEMLRTGLFVRHKAFHYWIDNPGINGLEIDKYCQHSVAEGRRSEGRKAMVSAINNVLINLAVGISAYRQA